MNLQQVAMTDFVLLRANWSADEGIALINGLKPSYVIVHRIEGRDDYFYLFPSNEALTLLKGAKDAPTIRQALDLHESVATPALEGSTTLMEYGENIPDRCVVLENGRPIAYFDANSQPIDPTN